VRHRVWLTHGTNQCTTTSAGLTPTNGTSTPIQTSTSTTPRSHNSTINLKVLVSSTPLSVTATPVAILHRSLVATDHPRRGLLLLQILPRPTTVEVQFISPRLLETTLVGRGTVMMCFSSSRVANRSFCFLPLEIPRARVRHHLFSANEVAKKSLAGACTPKRSL